MRFRDILIWLGIFIVGSLVVTFLVSPESFQSFKYNVKSTTDNFIDSFKDREQVGTLEDMEEIDTKISCFQIEIGVDYYGIDDKDLKEQECKNQCAQRIMKYEDFKCEVDKLYCYCLKR